MYYKKIYLPDGTEKLISCEDLEARYDSEGNEISSFYLPRSAGSGYPIEGNLYMDADEGVYRSVYFRKSGQIVAKVQHTNNGAFCAALCDGGGSSLNGLQATASGTLYLFGNNNNVVFRPRGLSDSDYMAWVTKDGEANFKNNTRQAKIAIDANGGRLEYYNNSALSGAVGISDGGYVNVTSNKKMPIIFRNNGASSNAGAVMFMADGIQDFYNSAGTRVGRFESYADNFYAGSFVGSSRAAEYVRV